MKVAISAYLDVLDKEITGQVDSAGKLDLSFISLRYVSGKRIFELSEGEVNSIKQALRNSKIRAIEIDTMFDAYNVNDTKEFEHTLDLLTSVCKIASSLNILNIIVNLPIYTEDISDYDRAIAIINEYCSMALKYKKRILLERKSESLGSSFTYIVTNLKHKNFGIVFNPSFATRVNESVTTNYRILKKYITNVRLSDTDSSNEPQLLGYGDGEIIKLFKKMIRDEYKHHVTLDIDFSQMISETNGAFVKKEKKGLMRLFSDSEIKMNKKNEKYFLFKKRLFIPLDQEVSHFDVFLNQIQVLNKIFK